MTLYSCPGSFGKAEREQVWHALVRRAQLCDGEWVLVNAAGSGVEPPVSKSLGLLGGRVIVSASSDEKLAQARELGAEVTINYRSDDLASRVRETTGGRGVGVSWSPEGRRARGQPERLDKDGRTVTVGARAEGGRPRRCDPPVPQPLIPRRLRSRPRSRRFATSSTSSLRAGYGP